MSNEEALSEEQRRLRNLQAVARHLAQRNAGETAQAEPAGPRRGRPWKRWGPLGALLVFALGKLKLLVPLLKIAKLHTLLSMLLAVWVYAQFWGAAFALGFVLLIFVHECGHAIVMRQQGIPAGAPVFIPFVGAVIAMKALPRNAYVEALVGIGGPLVGSAAALVCLIVGWANGSLFWYALAESGFLLNLFNMIPISPLDGGRIVGVISRWLWVVGYAVGIAIFLVTFHPLLLVILLLGLFQLRRSLRSTPEGYYDIAPARRIAVGAGYFGLLGALSLGMWVTEQRLAHLKTGESGPRPRGSQQQAAEPGRPVEVRRSSEGGRPAAELGLAVPRALDAVEIGPPHAGAGAARSSRRPGNAQPGRPAPGRLVASRTPAQSRTVPAGVDGEIVAPTRGVVHGRVEQHAARVDLELQVTDRDVLARSEEQLHHFLQVQRSIPLRVGRPDVAVLAVEAHVQGGRVAAQPYPRLLLRGAAAVGELERTERDHIVPGWFGALGP